MPKRLFLRYGLRTFLAVITVLAVLLGRYVHQVHKQRAAVAWVEANGGKVRYDFGDGEPTGPAWLRSLVGVDGVATVTQAWFPYDTPGSNLTPLANLTSLELLYLNNPDISDLAPLSNLTSLKFVWILNADVSDLSPLANLGSIEFLELRGTQASNESVEELKKALPKLEVSR